MGGQGRQGALEECGAVVGRRTPSGSSARCRRTGMPPRELSSLSIPCRGLIQSSTSPAHGAFPAAAPEAHRVGEARSGAGPEGVRLSSVAWPRGPKSPRGSRVPAGRRPGAGGLPGSRARAGRLPEGRSSEGAALGLVGDAPGILQTQRAAPSIGSAPIRRCQVISMRPCSWRVRVWRTSVSMAIPRRTRRLHSRISIRRAAPSSVTRISRPPTSCPAIQSAGSKLRGAPEGRGSQEGTEQQQAKGHRGLRLPGIGRLRSHWTRDPHPRGHHPAPHAPSRKAAWWCRCSMSWASGWWASPGVPRSPPPSGCRPSSLWPWSG